MESTREGALAREDGVLGALAAVLRESGYGAAATATTAGDLPTARRLQGAAALLAASGEVEDPGLTLLALFWVGVSVDWAQLQQALPHCPLGALEDLEFIRREGDRAVPVVRIDVAEELFVVADRDGSRAAAVVGVSASTLTVAAFTPRGRFGRALDLGTGSGMLALLAARHAQSVVATDVLPRALVATELNARLNGIGSLQLREGNMFEPVQGELFDLVICNPPYVISPGQQFVYRDSAAATDELSRSVLAQMPTLLADGGMATMQVNWVHTGQEGWADPVGRVLPASGCDAIVVRLGTETPLQYAMFWAAPQHTDDPEGLPDALRRWYEYLDGAGVKAITTAMVVLRRRDTTRPTRCAATLDGLATARIGEGLPRRFATHERLATMDEAMLGAAVLRPAEDLSIERTITLRDGDEACVLRAAGALSVRRVVAPVIADGVAALDGERPLADTAAGSEPAVRVEMLELLKLGFLEFSED